MQTLLVDLGNSRIKWAMQNGQVMQASTALAHRGQEFSAILAQAWTPLTRPARVVIASVTDPVRQDSLAQWVQQHWSVSAEFVVSPAQGHGLTNAYQEPTRLGCDRWAAMVAAYQHAHSAVCVVDCGSAVTVDVVDATGQHQGGLILPGVHAMSETLTRHTTLAPVDVSNIPPGLLGTSTQAGIARGITFAISSVVQQMMSDLKQTRNMSAVCYLTGGDSAVIAPLLRIPYMMDADLVLKGLAIITHAT